MTRLASRFDKPKIGKPRELNFPSTIYVLMRSHCLQIFLRTEQFEKLVEKIFNEIERETYNFDGVVFSKESLTKTLELCAKDQLFLFNGNSMGSPLGPPLANFYVSYLEVKPQGYKFYR